MTDKEKINALFERISDLRRELTAYQEWAEDVKRLTRELDVLLNGENAAGQASLCDIVAQIKREIRVAHDCWEASIREGK
jgi:tRNA U34 5-carboxymethylaminomethyl modifying GTPase MnmE/TrmE